MSWLITLHPSRPPNPKVGDMWPTTTTNHYGVSERYKTLIAALRPPMMVRLPGNVDFCIDMPAAAPGGGWKVTGEPPEITLYPSVRVTDIFHGWIKNGVIHDDVDGRVYNDDGHLIREPE